MQRLQWLHSLLLFVVMGFVGGQALAASSQPVKKAKPTTQKAKPTTQKVKPASFSWKWKKGSVLKYYQRTNVEMLWMVGQKGTKTKAFFEGELEVRVQKVNARGVASVVCHYKWVHFRQSHGKKKVNFDSRKAKDLARAKTDPTLKGNASILKVLYLLKVTPDGSILESKLRLGPKHVVSFPKESLQALFIRFSQKKLPLGSKWSNASLANLSGGVFQKLQYHFVKWVSCGAFRCGAFEVKLTHTKGTGKSTKKLGSGWGKTLFSPSQGRLLLQQYQSRITMPKASGAGVISVRHIYRNLP